MADGKTAWDFAFNTINGQPMALANFQGKAVLLVNTASKCGFTPQYKGLEELWRAYRDKGLVVVGVPSNDFGGQEPGDAIEIQTFCEDTFEVDFPLTGKTTVSGSNAHPFYRWAREQLGPLAVPRWNFHKYLIAPDGRLADWFSTVTAPDAGRVIKAIEKVLPTG